MLCDIQKLLELQHTEELFQDNSENNKYVLFPIQDQYKDVWDLFKLHESLVWKRDDLDIDGDVEYWRNLDEDKKYFIKMILAFFAASDGIVNENLTTNFASEVQVSPIRSFYAIQEYIEVVHGESYAALIETYIQDEEERDKLFHAIENYPCIRKKAEWTQQWMTRDIPFAVRLLAFSVVEGLFFQGSFCAIFWLKDQGVKLKGLFAANEYISRDEGLHCKGAVMIFKKLKYKPNQQIVHDILKDAVFIESQFITESIKCDMIGMNSNLMTQFIKFMADRLLVQLGYDKLFNVKNPFDFMEKIGMDNKTNFHARRVTDYSRGKITKIKNLQEFSTDDDF